MPLNSIGLLVLFLESNYNHVIHIIIKDNSIPLRIVTTAEQWIAKS